MANAGIGSVTDKLELARAEMVGGRNVAASADVQRANAALGVGKIIEGLRELLSTNATANSDFSATTDLMELARGMFEAGTDIAIEATLGTNSPHAEAVVKNGTSTSNALFGVDRRGNHGGEHLAGVAHELGLISDGLRSALEAARRARDGLVQVGSDISGASGQAQVFCEEVSIYEQQVGTAETYNLHPDEVV